VRDLERAGVPRSVAMRLVGHRPQAIYDRYAIMSEGDQREGAAKLAALHGDPPAQDAPPTHINAHQGGLEARDQGSQARKPRQDGASGMARDGIVAQQTRVVLWWGRGVHRRHEDFQSADIAVPIGTHVHGMTSNDVVTRLSAVELCH